MKPLCASLFIACILAAPGAWSDDIRAEIAVVDNPAENYLAICGYEFDVDGGGYSTCTIDLNGDGRKDQMFANAATSGTGGTAATIYLARDDGRFTRIGSLGHGSIAAEATKDGRRLLHCSWSFGGGSTSITTYTISHDGLREIAVVGGESADVEYQKRFDSVFASSLELEYKFVRARPKPKAEQNGAGNGGSAPARTQPHGPAAPGL